MTVLESRQGGWNAARVLQALGRIGYDPVSAILDITDNSLSAEATKIEIKIERTAVSQQGSGRRRAIISSFSILDNGLGMDLQGLHNALVLGSPDLYYSKGTLSKFGMGLKSAALSLGRRLEIISRSSVDVETVNKVSLDYDRIVETGEYIYDVEQVTERDLIELESICTGGSGTLVRITKILTESMPSISEILQKLKQRAGIVYYYYIRGEVGDKNPITISVDGEPVVDFDPLFVTDAQGDLDELSWDGLDVKWITHSKPIPLDLEGTRYATIEITQLPHPPSVEQAGKMSRKHCLEHYMIDSESYGFYIYRNHRLISWPGDVPVKLMGVRTKASDLYAFRGRILITSDADDLLNIDVTKNRIQFSEIANMHLEPEVGDAIKKSRTAWNIRTNILKRIVRSNADVIVNQAIDEAERLSERDDQIDEEVVGIGERRELESKRNRAISAKPAKEEEIKRLREAGERVQFVGYLNNNQLWERAHDPAQGLIVRINQAHKFTRDILTEQQDNAELVKAMALVFFGLARGEYDLVYKSNIPNLDSARLEMMMQDFRERVGGALSEMLTRIEIRKLFDEE